MSGTSFRESIQPALTLYSQSFDTLNKKFLLMDSKKAEWTGKLNEYSVVKAPTDKTKASARETALKDYDSLVKAKDYAVKLFTTLCAVHQKCTRKLIPQDAYETMTGLEQDSPTTSKKEKALIRVNAFIQLLAERVRVVLKDPMESRLPQAAQELDALIKYIDTGVVETRIWGWTKNKFAATPNLDLAYKDWKQLKAAVDKPEPVEESKESLVISKPKAQASLVKVEEAVPEVEETDLKELSDALFTLGLNYQDPHTNKRYGLQSIIEVEETVRVEDPDVDASTLPSSSDVDPHSDTIVEESTLASSLDAGPSAHSDVAVEESNLMVGTATASSDLVETQESPMTLSAPPVSVSRKPEPPKGPHPSKIQAMLASQTSVAGKPHANPSATSGSSSAQLKAQLSPSSASSSNVEEVVEQQTGTDQPVPVPTHPTKPPLPKSGLPLHTVVVTASTTKPAGATQGQKKTV